MMIFTATSLNRILSSFIVTENEDFIVNPIFSSKLFL